MDAVSVGVESTRGKAEERPPTTSEGLGFLRLVWSDYLSGNRMRQESTLRRLLLIVPRMIYNPSLQLALLVRIAQRGPRVLWPMVRWLEVTLFSSEIYNFRGDEAIVLGPGVAFPHPMNIMIGPGARIGAGVAIYNNVSIGTDQAGLPQDVFRRAATIGDSATILPYTTVMGPFRVGRDSIVGMHVVLRNDVPAGAWQTMTKLRLAGEYDRARLHGTPVHA